jgi:hypothetical protein
VHFKEAFLYFANYPSSWEFPHWGVTVRTTELPWSYVPAQLLARLPEGFLLLLVVGLLFGGATSFAIQRLGSEGLSHRRLTRLQAAVVFAARSRRTLIVWAAVIMPLSPS